MDGRRFDEITRAVVAHTSRRAALRTVVGGGLSALAGALGGRGSGAVDRGPGAAVHTGCMHQGQVCGGDEDPACCGATECTPSGVCCPAYQAACNAVNPCGSTDQVCVAGLLYPRCADDNDCPFTSAGATCCGGACFLPSQLADESCGCADNCPGGCCHCTPRADGALVCGCAESGDGTCGTGGGPCARCADDAVCDGSGQCASLPPPPECPPTRRACRGAAETKCCAVNRRCSVDSTGIPRCRRRRRR